ncbi:Transcription factor bHLH80 [Heracleum sosnowskyi]|uniref:Transcription factor bHLH80 n=1 Tax=Heracleum sosnowskyi TaxID=360622 RepID=A0AAD8HV72_9APIA|nr:Transcription factor bHLH80 [Heracleum sosnowskyi]
MYNVEGSRIIAREMDGLLAASNFMYPIPAADHFSKNKETVHSETYNYMNNHNSSQQQSSNLSRYQPVPSSFLESLVNDSVVADEYHSSNLETEMNSFYSGNFKYTKGLKTDSVKNSVSRGVEDLFRGFGSNAGGENMNQVKKEISNANRSSLVRQSSSPAGFMSSLTDDDIGTGFAGMNGVGNFRSSNKTTNAGLSSTTNKFGNYVDFSSGPSSHSRFMPQSAANANENIGSSDSYLANGHNGGNSNRRYAPNFQNDPTSNSLKRNRDGEVKMLSNMTGLDKQNDGFNHYTSGLVHQLSLPSTSAEMATMENFLQFQQDSIPCKVRAKRGFATHPRSIAERVRRTRISARMKKLQDLFPNMDKQANTADMLDLAVVYIKDLQKEVQTLSQIRSKCTCPNLRKQLHIFDTGQGLNRSSPENKPNLALF